MPISRALVIVTFAAAVGVSGLASHSQAQSTPPQPPETFDSYGNQPGEGISLQVWQAHDWKAALARSDTDGDGRISSVEFATGRCRGAGGALRCIKLANLEFLALDRNRNGFLDREEMDARSANLFRANDLNHDGYVTRAEMERLAGRH